MRLTILLLGVLLASCAKSPSEQSQIEVSAAWARPTASGQSAAAAYLTIDNGGGADRLTRVATEIGQASLHSTTMDNGIMRMRHVEAVDLPQGQSVELKPGGLHVMIMGLRQPLQAGSTFPLTLTFDTAGERNVTIDVRNEAPVR